MQGTVNGLKMGTEQELSVRRIWREIGDGGTRRERDIREKKREPAEVPNTNLNVPSKGPDKRCSRTRKWYGISGADIDATFHSSLWVVVTEEKKGELAGIGRW